MSWVEGVHGALLSLSPGVHTAPTQQRAEPCFPLARKIQLLLSLSAPEVPKRETHWKRAPGGGLGAHMPPPNLQRINIQRSLLLPSMTYFRGRERGRRERKGGGRVEEAVPGLGLEKQPPMASGWWVQTDRWWIAGCLGGPWCSWTPCTC